MKISDEKFTPLKYLESARKVFGGTIDLDPASSVFANTRIKADHFFNEKVNGLYQDWFGNVWLNPPYSRSQDSNLLSWISKLCLEYQEQRVKQAILLTPNWTERKWFQKLWNFPICFTDHRIEFIDGIVYMQTGKSVLLTNPEGGSCFTYFGSNELDFYFEFKKYGHIINPFGPLECPKNEYIDED